MEPIAESSVQNTGSSQAQLVATAPSSQAFSNNRSEPVAAAEKRRQSPIKKADYDSDYEEQSFRSEATIRLSQQQPILLPPYKRDGLPGTDPLPAAAASVPAATAAEDDDLTYERLGRQFRDLTAKVSEHSAHL